MSAGEIRGPAYRFAHAGYSLDSRFRGNERS